MKSLKENNFIVHKVKTKEDAKHLIIDIIPEGSTIGFGGSVTLEQIGILDHYRNSIDCELFDRTTALSADEKRKILHQCLDADYYLTSTNAMTDDGKLVNIDATGNRVSAMCYGPNKVIVVAGKNKVVKDVDAAIKRIKNGIVKKNARRLEWHVPCIGLDKCIDCKSDKRMCCTTVIHEYQKDKRITIILVDEDLGY